MKALVLALSLLASLPVLAVEPAERLPDPAMEARARNISAELRCLVCQNESIDESHADLAKDIRRLVRERLTAGDSNAEAQQAVVDRYGDFVLLRPPVKPATYVLWFAPVVLLVSGLGGTILWLRHRVRSPESVAPLTEAERGRLDQLLSDRVIQTSGDPASGHHAQSDRVIQTSGDPASGHHAQGDGA